MNDYFFHDAVRPEQMDALWASGWRHFGSYFYRYSTTLQGGRQRRVLPLRIRLEEFRLNRSQKRCLKGNRDLRLSIGPAFVDARVEALFEKHKTRFRENVPSSIYTFVSRRPQDLPCSCKSLCLFLEDRLIGVSYLDVGETSSSSVYQCFDPEHSARSPGILMVLLSIRYATSLGQRYYYPGYAYVEPSHYDYKKGFHALESYDWKQGWRTYPKQGGTARATGAPPKGLKP